MVTPRLSRAHSRSQLSPLLRVKQSISRLRPTWRPPGRVLPDESTARSSPLRSSGKQTHPLDHLARHSSRHGNRPDVSKPSHRSEISVLPELPGHLITECAQQTWYPSTLEDVGCSKREMFLIYRKKEDLRERGARPNRPEMVPETHSKFIKKSLSTHFPGGIWSAMKGSLKKKTVSTPLATSQTDERNPSFDLENAQANSQEMSHISNSLSPDGQDEAIDSAAHDLHPTTSRESLHSNTRSRVTSWTDSSMAGSVALRSGPLELNRLSVIKEDGGPHQPSSSAGRHIGGVGLFQEPLESTTSNGQTLLPVDSQRIYSALIERIKLEEAEIEETAAALEVVNLKRAKDTTASTERGPTIRFVKSDPSLTGAVCADSQPPLSNPSLREAVLDESPNPEQYKNEMLRTEEHLQAWDSFPSFLPFAAEQKCSRPSPFQQIFRQKRTHSVNTDSGHDVSNLSVNPYSDLPSFGRTRFGNGSSDSIYSRATDGLPRDSHVSSGASSVSLVWSPSRLSKSKSMVEPNHTMRIVSQATSPPLPVSYNAAEIHGCNSWSNSRHSSIGTHVREQAQIHSEDARNQVQSVMLEYDDIGLSFRHPNLRSDHSNAGTEIHTPTSTRNRMKMFFKRTTSAQSRESSKFLGDENNRSNGMSSKAQRAPYDPLDVGLSLSRTAKEGQKKENHVFDCTSTPPLSTPGRLHLQLKNGSLNGKLKKRTSDILLNSRRRDLHVTPTSIPQTTSVSPSDAEDSPTQRAKDRLVARLSRPFDMDVPRHNRPFDSMFLGKRTPGHADTLGDSRLSVAPRASKSYGGLRMPDQDIEASAFPAAASSSSSISRSVSKIAGLFSGKRMVSNFLKSRQVHPSVSTDEKGTYAGSPAFI